MKIKLVWVPLLVRKVNSDESDDNESPKNNSVSPGTADVGQGQASIRGQGRRRGRGRGRGRGIRQQGRRITGNTELPNDDWNWNNAYSGDSTQSAPLPFDAQDSGPSTDAEQCSSPEEFFQLLFTNELLQSIVENTNLYAA